MGGETEKSVSGWSVDTLKSYVERLAADQKQQLVHIMDERDRRYEERFKATDEKTSLALTASEKAVTKAEIATEKRFDAVNEFRGTLSDQAANLLPRAEASVRFTSLEKDLDAVRQDTIRILAASGGGKAVKDEGRANVAMIVGLIGALIAVGGIVFAALK